MNIRVIRLIGLAVLMLSVSNRSFAQPFISIPRTTFSAGEEVTVNFGNLPGNQKDWIGLYTVAAGDRSWVTWQYTAGKKEGSLKFTLPRTPGQYQFRVFLNDGYTMLCKSEKFQVNAQPVITGKPTIVLQDNIVKTGQDHVITFSGFPGNAKDWIGLFLISAGERQWVGWQYVNGQKNGSMKFKAPQVAGRYEYRAFANDGYTLLCKSSSFDVVSASPQLSVPKSQLKPGESVTVSFTGFPTNPADWIGLYTATAGDRQFITWKYTEGRFEGSVTFAMPTTPGEYQLRAFKDNGYELICKSSLLTVVR